MSPIGTPRTGGPFRQAARQARRARGANDASAYVGEAAYSHTAGELRYRFDGAGNTAMQMEVDGDGQSDICIVLNGEIALVAGALILSRQRRFLFFLIAMTV